MVSLFVTQPNRKLRRMIWLASFSFFLSFVTSFGVQRVRMLYLMNSPFCFDAITIGWYTSGRDIVYNIANIVAVPLLYRYLPGVGLGMLGAATNMIEYLTYALSTKPSQLLIALFMSFGQSLPVSLIRGETSRLLGPEMQGQAYRQAINVWLTLNNNILHC
ncbi:uncharacterized protein LOC118478565 [Aplysia californica]|uniref:Uncharacterized protein LOC118478565 n=1 Tax=Aplysia californica TaxID=6500 RepID=A0ABM1W0X0_APLCA|nr:uncharacterized protein LOC118478565 [Aplysia californica]